MIIPELEMLRNMYEEREHISFFRRDFNFTLLSLAAFIGWTAAFIKLFVEFNLDFVYVVWQQFEVTEKSRHLWGVFVSSLPREREKLWLAVGLWPPGTWLVWANMLGSSSEGNRFSLSLLLHLFVQRKCNVISKVCFQMKEISSLKRVPQSRVYSGFLVCLLVPWTLVHFSLL